MADAVVSIVLERLTDSVIDELKFLDGVSDQVEIAQSQLQLMQGYLKYADSRQGDNVVRIWVASIRDAAYDLDDAIETFVLEVASRRKTQLLAGLLDRKDTVEKWTAVHKNIDAYIRRGTNLGPNSIGEAYEGAKEKNFVHIINYSIAVEIKETPNGRVRRLAIYLDETVEACCPGRDERDGHVREKELNHLKGKGIVGVARQIVSL
ncbi:unnamed protein product [Prunus armeniaca]